MKTITSFKIAGLITACLFAAMPTKADIGAISFKTSAAGMNALETTIGSNQMTLETWLYIDNSTGSPRCSTSPATTQASSPI